MSIPSPDAPDLLQLPLFATSLSGMLFRGRDHRGPSWRDLAEGRLRLDRLSRNGVGSTFFPWSVRPAWASPRGDPGTPIPREPRNSRRRHPPLRFGPQAGASVIALGLQIAIEAAVVAGSRPAKET
jgi:hypothetical protein